MLSEMWAARIFRLEMVSDDSVGFGLWVCHPFPPAPRVAIRQARLWRVGRFWVTDQSTLVRSPSLALSLP